MKIFSPHRRRMEAKRRYGSKEFKNKVKNAQNYKRVFDPNGRGFVAAFVRFLRLDSVLVRLGVGAAVLAAGYFLFFSPYFLVNQVAVSGNQQVTTEQISQAFKDGTAGRSVFTPKNHLLLLSKRRMAKILSSSQPLVKEIKGYKRVWPNRIEMEIAERHPGFALVVDGKTYLVDDEGLVVKELPEAQGLPSVVDQVSEPVQAGERLNNTKLVAFVLSASRQWPNKINSQLKEIRVPGKAANQAQFMSAEGWGVFFDVARPAEAQLSNLALILNRQIPANRRLQLAYIDLRFDKWAYYCYKDQPCEAQPQDNPEAEAPDAEKVEVEE
jgi:cell division septal protein FtsQ